MCPLATFHFRQERGPMFSTMKTLLLDNSGQGLAEYSLILLFVALAVLLALEAAGKKILGMLDSTINSLPN